MSDNIYPSAIYSIYKIVNKIDNKVFVGTISKDIRYAWRRHKHRSDNPGLRLAIETLGIDNFYIDCLYQSLDKDYIKQMSIQFIAEYNSTDLNFGYNNRIYGGGNLHNSKYNNPPKCKNPGCVSSSYWRGGGNNWSQYCCNTCYYSHKKILQIGVGKKPPKIQKECINPSCSNLVKITKGILQGKYCCSLCSNMHVRGKTYQKRTDFILTEPLKLCEHPTCNNLVGRRNKHSGHWLNYCSKLCERNHVVIKNKKTCLEKYNVENPMQCAEVFNKQEKSSKRFKDYTFPSGKIVRIQGCEYKALDELLKIYNEYDIINDRTLVPKIWYETVDDKKHKYYPDIFIPKDNLIIEVKSKWTYNGKPIWKETNLLKEKACIAAGYNFKFMIY
jgi:hypothetical protein